ncbi:MAG TPA: hypothetical protein VGH16_18360 [Candidatus Binatia bacterium]|jgi:predicted permease
MADKKLVALILLGGVLYFGHAIDHIARGDVRWPLGAESLPFIVVTVIIYALIGFGIYFYRRNKIGPRFWTIFAALGAAFGFIGHFSPFTEQPPRYIFNAYSSTWAGSLALSCLFALMFVLIATTIYAGYLWARGPR